jgi:hypothetical protein
MLKIQPSGMRERGALRLPRLLIAFATSMIEFAVASTASLKRREGPLARVHRLRLRRTRGRLDAAMTSSATRESRGAMKTLVSIVAAVVVLLAHAGAALSAPANARDNVAPVSRHQLSGDIYEYRYVLSTGNGTYAKVGVHRVVKERDGHPISSGNGVFLAHGDAWDFNGAFLGGTSSPESLPVYLAGKGIDVWGIDFGWTLVPAETTDFEFMKDWGLQRDLDDLEEALSFARSVRAHTGSPGNRLTLLAWSRGAWTGYALLGQESQKPKEQRHVRSYVSVDNFFKVNDPTVRSTMCAFEEGTNADIAAGIYAYGSDFVVQLGELAKSHPDDVSPLFGPPYTNLQAALTFGAATYQFGPTFAPYYHFFGGTFPGGDIWGIPDGLRYTTIARFTDFLTSPSPFESSTMIRDTLAISCGERDTPFDDHLGDVTVPVLYVGAGGGFGTGGLYTLSLLGSKDVSSTIVSFFPPDEAAFDFGHADLFNAQDAKKLVWSPIYKWLSQHGSPDH